jgi:hypothetical protein
MCFLSFIFLSKFKAFTFNLNKRAIKKITIDQSGHESRQCVPIEKGSINP